MKVIVINEDDGYCRVLNCTVANLKKCLQEFVDMEQLDDIDSAQSLIENDNATIEQLEVVIPTGRSHGCIIFIEEIAEWPEYSYHPWS